MFNWQCQLWWRWSGCCFTFNTYLLSNYYVLGLILDPVGRALNKTNSLSPQEALHRHRVSSSTISKPLVSTDLMWGLDSSWTTPGVSDPYKFTFFMVQFENHMLEAGHLSSPSSLPNTRGDHFPVMCPFQFIGNICLYLFWKWKC